VTCLSIKHSFPPLISFLSPPLTDFLSNQTSPTQYTRSYQKPTPPPFSKMKLSLTFLTLPLSIAAAAAVLDKRDPLPSKFTLESSSQGIPDLIWTELQWLGGSAYIGNSRYNSASEKLEFTSGGDGLSFTSYHSAPTGWTSFYIFPSESRAVGFTTPHSGSVPAGAATTGFENVGGQLAYQGRMEWQACDQGGGTYQIYWNGASSAGCVPIGLYIRPSAC